MSAFGELGGNTDRLLLAELRRSRTAVAPGLARLPFVCHSPKGITDFQSRGNDLLVAPERPKAVGRELGVTHGMHDVAMPKVSLDGPRVDTIVRQVITRRVSQHVRVDRELKTGLVASSRY